MILTDEVSLLFFCSGGMYNTNFPQWEDATATGNKKYDGQFAYAYAKRGQVLLCERWAAAHPKVFNAAVTPHCSICSHGIVTAIPLIIRCTGQSRILPSRLDLDRWRRSRLW